jgi:hypothetical protein
MEGFSTPQFTKRAASLPRPHTIGRLTNPQALPGPSSRSLLHWDPDIQAHKNTLKEELLQVINENFIEILLDMVNQNVQEAPQKFQDNKNKECEKTHTKKVKSSEL